MTEADLQLSGFLAVSLVCLHSSEVVWDLTIVTMIGIWSSVSVYCDLNCLLIHMCSVLYSHI